MGRKPTTITEYQFKILNDRIKKMQGFQMTVNSFRNKLDLLINENRLLKNDIKTLHQRIDKLKMRFIHPKYRK